MSKPRIVRGWKYADETFDCGYLTIYEENADNAARLKPVLLVPADGSQVVVSREEWERMREALALPEVLGTKGGGE